MRSISASSRMRSVCLALRHRFHSLIEANRETLPPTVRMRLAYERTLAAVTTRTRDPATARGCCSVLSRAPTKRRLIQRAPAAPLLATF